MLNLFLKTMASFIDKLHIEYKENPDGTGDITIEWDETDPDLAMWTAWGEDKQKQFVIDALNVAVFETIDEELSLS